MTNNNQINSSSINRITSDKGLTPYQRVVWFVINFFDNMFNESLSPCVKINNLSVDRGQFDSLNREIDDTSSPSRRLSLLFFHTYNWRDNIPKSSHAKILEIGCGTGIYSQLFDDVLSEPEYTGLDIMQNSLWFKYKSKRVSFVQSPAKDIKDIIDNYNIVFTQSSLEHIEEDVKLFDDIYENRVSKGRPTMQVHLFPASSTLFTYLWHGYRQNNFRKINKLISSYSKESQIEVIRIGGFKTFFLHLSYITFPFITRRKDKRETHGKLYKSKVLAATFGDLSKTKGMFTSFYALIIKSNY